VPSLDSPSNAHIPSNIFNTAIVADRRRAVCDLDHEAGRLSSAGLDPGFKDQLRLIFVLSTFGPNEIICRREHSSRFSVDLLEALMNNSKKDLPEKDPADREQELRRLRAMQEETTDPMAARLLTDIVDEMEAELSAEQRGDGEKS
jgi:hypothetical protein